MKHLKHITLSALLFSAFSLFAQSYRITNFYMTKNGTPRAINQLWVFSDSTLTTYNYDTKDTAVETFKIKERKKNGDIYLSNGRVYIFSKSKIDGERGSVFYIESTTAPLENKDRKSMYFRAVIES